MRWILSQRYVPSGSSKGEGDDENPNDTSVVSYSVEDSIIVNYFTPVV